MRIKDRDIGPNQFPLIIAEIGINHGGDIEIAKKMVFKAAKVGAECIKHQTNFVEDEMTIEAKNIYPPNADLSIWDVNSNSSLSKDEEVQLKKYTESLGMIYISTPFSRSAADFLAEIGVPAFKIGSGECTNIPLIRHIAKFNKPIILSTGMSTEKNFDNVLKIRNINKKKIIFLLCTSEYPTSHINVNINKIDTFLLKYVDSIPKTELVYI